MTQLEHAGILGMHWGSRQGNSSNSNSSGSSSSKNIVNAKLKTSFTREKLAPFMTKHASAIRRTGNAVLLVSTILAVEVGTLVISPKFHDAVHHAIASTLISAIRVTENVITNTH